MEYLIITISVFIVALVFSMFGMGGGLIYMPLFLLFVKNYQFASFLSFFCIFVTAFAAMNVYRKEKLIDWALVKFLGIPLVVMTFLTGFVVRSVPFMAIKMFLGVTLALAGILMILSKNNILSSELSVKKYRFAPVFLSPITLLIGGLAGMSGVAGGVFEIPLMTTVLRVPAHTAVATSSVIVFLAAASGFIGRIIGNSQNIGIRFDLFLCVLVCAFLGGRIGPKISLNISKQVFKRFCGVFVFVIGAYYIIEVFK